MPPRDYATQAMGQYMEADSNTYTTLLQAARLETEVCTSACRRHRLSAPLCSSVQVKKSKFLATAWPCSTGARALQLIKAASDAGANHNCWGENGALPCLPCLPCKSGHVP